MIQIMEKKVPKRILNLLIGALSAGVVPREGAPYVAIGRKEETEALLSDLENVADGGSSLRFLVGRYGSGKSFLLQLIRGYALENGFVTMDADLSPERRLCGTNGAGIATYRELIKNMATRSSPDGGAIQTVIARWLSEKQAKLAANGISQESPVFAAEMRKEIYAVTGSLEDKVGGFDFATVINRYYEAKNAGDDRTVSEALRWLRGEYLTRTEARRELGVQGIITDENWYDYLKLMAEFVRQIGYRGLTVYIDECVNLYKITNRVSRENNYEKILSIFNDTLQGKAPYFGIIFVGTPAFLEDTRRGLFSYDALRSRLSDGVLVSGRFRNLAGPVIRLVRLTDSELFALITRVGKLYSDCYGYTLPIGTEENSEFLRMCLEKAGADSMITPREIIRSYIGLLHIMRQNPGVSFTEVMGKASGELKASRSESEDDVLEDFEL